MNETSTRRCGDCAACCTTHAVTELDKPAGTPCASLRRGAKPCAVYETRPEGCRAFQCFWLRGLGSLRQRPDRLGVVFDLVHSANGTPVVRAMEVRPGAADRPEAAALLRLVNEKHVVSICRDGVIREVLLMNGRRVTQAEFQAMKAGQP